MTRAKFHSFLLRARQRWKDNNKNIKKKTQQKPCNLSRPFKTQPQSPLPSAHSSIHAFIHPSIPASCHRERGGREDRWGGKEAAWKALGLSGFARPSLDLPLNAGRRRRSRAFFLERQLFSMPCSPDALGGQCGRPTQLFCLGGGGFVSFRISTGFSGFLWKTGVFFCFFFFFPPRTTGASCLTPLNNSPKLSGAHPPAAPPPSPR